MSDTLEFIGQAFQAIEPNEAALSIRILSDYPTVANAGVKLFRDNGDNTISQVGHGQVIDTSVDTPEGDNALLALAGSGKYALAFQGQGVAIDGTAVTVAFEVRTATGRLLESFNGSRTLAGAAARINGTAFIITRDLGVQA